MIRDGEKNGLRNMTRANRGINELIIWANNSSTKRHEDSLVAFIGYSYTSSSSRQATAILEAFLESGRRGLVVRPQHLPLKGERASRCRQHWSAERRLDAPLKLARVTSRGYERDALFRSLAYPSALRDFHELLCIPNAFSSSIRFHGCSYALIRSFHLEHVKYLASCMTK